MKHVNNSRRGRSRGSSSRRSSSKGHGFEGGEAKVRGTAKQVLDKYMALARDAALLGDRVASEEHFQRAEHYYRILHAESSADEQNAHSRGQPRDQNKVKPECVEPDDAIGTVSDAATVPGTASVSDAATVPGTASVSDAATVPDPATVSDVVANVPDPATVSDVVANASDPATVSDDKAQKTDAKPKPPKIRAKTATA